MSQRPIMDAGPGLNFFSLNKERLLFATLGPLAVPEIVEQEIVRKAGQDQRFEAAGRALGKIPSRLLEILSDEVTPELAAAVQRMAGVPIETRTRSSKDLGEIMVVAHAVVAAERGHRVLVLIDDGGGRKVAMREAARLRRMHESQPDVGSIALINTGHVLKKAAGGEHLPDRNSMRELYGRLRTLDDGLAPLEHTGLMDLSCWSQLK